MAITIHQTPQLWTPAYNDQWILALSTEIAQPLFKYKIEIMVTNSDGAITFTYYVLPRPDGYLVFNCKEIVKNFVKHFIKPNDFTVLECVDSSVMVDILIYETWTGEAGTGVIDATYFAWNACLTEKQMFLDTYNYVDYVSTASESIIHTRGNVLPTTNYTLLSDVFMHFVKVLTLDHIIYYVLDTNGVDILDTYTFNASSLTNNKIYQINVSPQLAISETLPMAVGYYVLVKFFTSLNTELASYQYLVSDPCTKHEIKRLYYLNRNGGISFMSFELKSTKNISKQTNDVKLNRNEIVSNTWTYKPYKHERNVVSTQETFSEVLNTNWITKLQSEYLEELFSSPMVWLVSEEDDYSDPYKFKPVVITDKSYEYKKHENEKLFNYSVVVEYSTTETRQRAI